MKKFHNLFNEGYEMLLDSNRLSVRKKDQDYNYYRQIKKHEVKEELKIIGNDKSIGSNNISIKVWKNVGGRGIS
jgi:hypothetical protein